MKRLNARLVATAIAFASSSAAFAAGLSYADEKAASQRIDTDAKAARAACASLAGNANSVCMVRAKGDESVAKAELDMRSRPGSKSRYDARVIKARADYTVARERCNDVAGNVQDVCIKEAKAAEVSANADALAERKIADADQTSREAASDARTRANASNADARNVAAEEKRDAAFSVAIEKCDVYAGGAKERCVQQAKTRFGKS